jgi:uncharacterized protein
MINKIIKIITEHFKRVIETKKSPHSIALGFTLGTLIALLPTPGFSVLIGILVVFIFNKINKYSLFGAIALWNPLVQIPIYTLSYKIGNLIFGSMPLVEYKISLLHQILIYTRRFLIGNVILAILISIISYIVVWLVASHYANKDK